MNFITRFLGWGATSASIVAMGGTCPCCGNSIALCPQSLALFGVIGGLIGCALRLIYRPAVAAPQPAPNRWARHDLTVGENAGRSCVGANK